MTQTKRIMKTIEVRATVEVPADATPQQIQEWVEFCLGVRSSIPISNPLAEYDLSADAASVY